MTGSLAGPTARRPGFGALSAPRSRRALAFLPAPLLRAAAAIPLWVLGGGAACTPLEPHLEGTLVAAVVSAEGGSEVYRVELLDAAAELLWTTDPEFSVTDFRASPDGRARYRLSHPLRADRERLVTRALTPGAMPTEVVVTGPGEPRLAGAAWTADGLVYGVQAGLGVDEGAVAAWEIHQWRSGASERRFVLDPVPDSPHMLVAWDEVAEVAALLRLPPEGGPADRIVLVSASGGAVQEVALRIGSGGWAVSPDGRHLAVVNVESWNLETVRLADGDRVVVAVGEGADLASGPFGLLWSADAAVLAWTQTGADGVTDHLRWARLSDDESGRMPIAAGSRALALSPDGASVLLQTVEGSLQAVRFVDGQSTDLRWSPGGDLWHVDWKPPYNRSGSGQ